MGSVYTVSQVTSYIKNMFTQDFALNRVSIKGEVSNCKYHTSGHIYFTLKDGGAQIAAVMFAGQRKGLDFTLAEGQEVIVSGTVDVYEKDGRYQLYAKEIKREGRGDLFCRFEKLRDELEEMGMFDGCYKQPIPKYATRIGIVTASTGAAIRDIMNISHRRKSLCTADPLSCSCSGGEGKIQHCPGNKNTGSDGTGCSDRRTGRRFHRRPVGI